MRRDPAGLGVIVLGLVVAAVVLWASSRLTWLSVDWDTPLRGRVTTTATGADTEVVLVPWALLALAAVAGILATSGWGRRVVGTVVALAGAWAVLRAVTGFAAPPAEAVPAAARTAGRVAGASVHPAGPIVAVVGALLLLGAGALTVLRAGTLPRLGCRYDAPGSPRDRHAGSPEHGPVTDTVEAHGDDPEGGDMWAALDAGRDPTAAPDEAVDPDASTRSAGRDGVA